MQSSATPPGVPPLRNENHQKRLIDMTMGPAFLTGPAGTHKVNGCSKVQARS